MIILGIDPGTATTGYGIIEKNQKPGPKNIRCITYGLVKTSPSFSAAERLKTLNEKLTNIIKEYQPAIMAVENVYFFKNLKTVMPVSQAKGVILFTAAKNKIPVFEFTPLQIKMAVVGYGRAEKEQVQKMVKLLLGLDELPKPDDAADALAAAICYANYHKFKSYTQTKKKGY